ncbi:hypothetical protein GCM10009760_47700 [Kitasatospora kazusensis]|uniref:Vitamin K epoxide reductase family protein n=1 Tax=Kitasatospora kazusensis TaxID=407974 RepID=A0ABP5LUV5_9ACTN
MDTDRQDEPGTADEQGPAGRPGTADETGWAAEADRTDDDESADPDDPTAWWALATGAVVGFLSSGVPAVSFFFALMPADSCASGSCGFELRPPAVFLGIGFLLELVLLALTAAWHHRSDRAVRWCCALAAPLMPWLALGAWHATLS